MDNKVLISIVIPVYNNECFLRECLDSVIHQTCKNLEIICINDGSTDSSLQILNEYAAKDDRVVVIDKENEGASRTRNIGIEKSSGEYIMFLDSDDWIDLETCEEAYNAIKENNSDICFFKYVREFRQKSVVKDIYDESIKVFSAEECRNILSKRIVGLFGKELRYPENLDALSPVCIKLYKSDLIKKNNLKMVDTSVICTCEDGLFNVQAFYFAKGAVYINKPFYHYRKYNQNSITTGYKKNLFNGWQSLYGLMQEFIDKNNCDESFTNSLYNRRAINLIGLGLNILANEKGMFGKISDISLILKNPEYIKAYKRMEFKYFPVHWKIFFFCAKIRFSIGIYILLCVMRKMIGK